MTINIDIKQFEALLRYIEVQKVIYGNKRIKFRIHSTDFYNDIVVEIRKNNND